MRSAQMFLFLSLILKTKAEELRARAAAGEDFDKLQQAAYTDWRSAAAERKIDPIGRNVLNSCSLEAIPGVENKLGIVPMADDRSRVNKWQVRHHL